MWGMILKLGDFVVVIVFQLSSCDGGDGCPASCSKMMSSCGGQLMQAGPRPAEDPLGGPLDLPLRAQ